jgi:hypothetical protein
MLRLTVCRNISGLTKKPSKKQAFSLQQSLTLEGAGVSAEFEEYFCFEALSGRREIGRRK